MTDPDALVAALEAVLTDPASRPSTRVQAASELRALRDAVPVPDPADLPVLSKAERQLVSDALYWHGFEELWTSEQRELMLRLGLTTQSELDDADETMARTLRAGRRPSERDEVAARRRRIAGP